MINKVILIGNLGQDPKVHTTQSNSVVTQLSVATSRRVKQADGQYADETEWHRVTCFGKTAEVARDYLAKGRQVYVEGRLQTTRWVDKHQIERQATSIVVETIRGLGKREDDQGAARPAATSSGGYEDAPF